MNLKLVVASMSILGLVSCPVFAATDAKEHHHNNHYHHHHVKHHHHVAHHEDDDKDYRDYKGMEPARPCTEACVITQETMLLESMTQNRGRAIPNPCYPDWYRRIMIAGGLAVDIGKWGNRNGNFMGENYQRLSLNDVYINLQAQVNDWVHAFASISYNTATINDPNSAFAFQHFAEFDAAYDQNEISGSRHVLQLEQAFATFGNFSVSPLFLQVGKQFQDFGRYEIHPITESFTQVLSKTLATSIKLGFIADGFTGAIFAFDDPLHKIHESSKNTNYGASLGYDMPGDCFGFDLGVAYLYNLIGVNDIAYAVNQFAIHDFDGDFESGFNRRVSGLAAYADVNSGPFTLGARYTVALDNFNVHDLPKNGIADLTTVTIGGETLFDTAVPLADARGAKPWAATVQAGYGFEAWCMNQNIYVGYQVSGEAAGLLLPKYRWLAGYGVDVAKWTTLAVEWDHDKAYSHANGGNSNTYNLVTLRAAVKFG